MYMQIGTKLQIIQIYTDKCVDIPTECANKNRSAFKRYDFASFGSRNTTKARHTAEFIREFVNYKLIYVA